MLADLLVLDLDDTLYLERDYVRSGFRAADVWASQTMGWKGLSEHCWNLFVSGLRERIFDLAVHHFQGRENPEITQQLVDVYRSHQPDIQLEDDAFTFLDRMQVENMYVALLTGGRPESQRIKVEALSLERRFEIIIYSGERGSNFDKPHAWPFEQLAQRVGGRFQRLTYVGDNPARDLAAPLHLGWRAVRIRRPNSLHEHAESPSGVREIKSFDQFDG